MGMVRAVIVTTAAAVLTTIGMASVNANTTAATPNQNSMSVSGTLSSSVGGNDTVASTITVGWGPIGVVVSPDGSTAYVANGLSGSVSVIAVGAPTPASNAAANANNTSSTNAGGSAVANANADAAAQSAATTMTPSDASTSPSGNMNSSGTANTAAFSATSNADLAPALDLSRVPVNPIIAMGAVAAFLLVGLVLIVLIVQSTQRYVHHGR